MRARLLGATALCLAFVSIAGADDAAKPPAPSATPAKADHAIVSGFESLYRDPAGPAVDGGLLLLGELNCVSCHKADDAATAALLPKVAPYLGEIAGRADPKFVQKFLTDPHGVKPGTTMPALLGHLPIEQAGPAAEALTHYLASLTQTKFVRTAVDAASIGRGQDLFHKVGCVACHAPRQERAVKTNDDEDEVVARDLNATSIPLSRKLHEKYSLAGLTGFLSDPLKVRPSGRMPNLNLSSTDTADIAQFLLKDTVAAAPLTMAIYDGKWTKLPDFAKLKPKSTGTTNGFDIPGFAGKDNFGVVIEGYLNIEKAGDYRFFLKSDDGSRLLIDGKKIVEHDGIHPPGDVNGNVKLDVGQHAIRVEYFEASGGEELGVSWQGPGFTRRAIPSSSLSSTNKPVAPEDVFTLDAGLAKKGEALFASLGCANCHQLGPNKSNVASKLTAKDLAALKPDAGCLAAEPAQGLPRYTLNARQKETLVAALRAIAGRTLVARKTPEAIHARMTALNCYACHQRGEIGGPIRERDPFFTANSPDLGDEGRVPPRLTGVGDKLLPEWFVTVLTKGGSARPYMDTRMPQFGAENLGPLAAQFTEVDLKNTPIPPVDLKVDDMKKHGQKLVGKEGLSCVSCHMFNKYRSLGIQAMDLTLMRDRLRPEWFHKYMLNPSELRPGTRMPQAFINGKSTFVKVLDGAADPQIASIWQFLADGRRAKMPVGVIPTGNELVVGGEALIYRNFIADAGPCAIGVGYPEGVNLAFDANHDRLALLWQGKFMDAALHWEGRGQGYQPPLGDRVIKFPTGATFAQLDAPDADWPKAVDKNTKDPATRFHGYHLDELRRPTFKYDLLLPGEKKVTIADFPYGVEDRAAGRDDALIRRDLVVTSDVDAPLVFARIAAGKIGLEGNEYVLDDALRIKPTADQPPLLRTKDGKQELLIPFDLRAGKPRTLRIDYQWKPKP
ncbi:MAG: PA14 domain-containing protein [Pirellulales bacterium]